MKRKKMILRPFKPSSSRFKCDRCKLNYSTRSMHLIGNQTVCGKCYRKENL